MTSPDRADPAAPLQPRVDALVAEATAPHRTRLADAAAAYAGALAAGGANEAVRSRLHVAAVALAAELAKWDRLTDWRAVFRGAHVDGGPVARDAAAVLSESAARYAANGEPGWDQLAAAAMMCAGKVWRTDKTPRAVRGGDSGGADT